MQRRKKMPSSRGGSSSSVFVAEKLRVWVSNTHSDDQNQNERESRKTILKRVTCELFISDDELVPDANSMETSMEERNNVEVGCAIATYKTVAEIVNDIELKNSRRRTLRFEEDEHKLFLTLTFKFN
ncbi:hypothetical protein OROGR_033073 [Orobanche gracilis]